MPGLSAPSASWMEERESYDSMSEMLSNPEVVIGLNDLFLILLYNLPNLHG